MCIARNTSTPHFIIMCMTSITSTLLFIIMCMTRITRSLCKTGYKAVSQLWKPSPEIELKSKNDTFVWFVDRCTFPTLDIIALKKRFLSRKFETCKKCRYFWLCLIYRTLSGFLGHYIFQCKSLQLFWQRGLFS